MTGKLVDAMNDMESTGALLPADLDWASIQTVADRLSIVATIRRAATAAARLRAPVTYAIHAARAAFGGAQPYLGHGLDFAALEHDVRREAHRERLREALRADDENAILTAASPDSYGATLRFRPQNSLGCRCARARQCRELLEDYGRHYACHMSGLSLAGRR
ncbi:MAG: hypothetical protein R2848_03535 [Thermomicrobiales bacterium]